MGRTEGSEGGVGLGLGLGWDKQLTDERTPGQLRKLPVAISFMRIMPRIPARAGRPWMRSSSCAVAWLDSYDIVC